MRHLCRTLFRALCALILIGGSASLPAQASASQRPPSSGKSSAERRASAYLESVRKQPPLLLAFLNRMPKGADLHSHLSGAIYAESLIDHAVQNNLCVDPTTSVLIAPPCDEGCARYARKPAIRCAYGDHVLYNGIIDAWSMRNWTPGESSGHDHFFATFDKYSLANANHVGDEMAEVASRAAQDHVQHLELMITADGGAASSLASGVEWDDDLPRMREKFQTPELDKALDSARKRLQFDESRMKSILKCETPQEDPGCSVSVRYLYQVPRGLSRETVFAHILFGFELASREPKFVGLNLVMPEDWYVPMHDFPLHMRILDYMHGAYPKVHISLHAGELAPGLVPPEGLRFHIRDSVEKGHAERIGHGVDVMHERDPLALLKEMATRRVAVEVCLTSNDVILGIAGDQHPFPVYRKYGVPVTLATDDQGVSRSDMTNEWLRAVETYALSYADLKELARQGLEHSFLPGSSLWREGDFHRRVPACTGDSPIAGRFSTPCTTFLDENEKARSQWMLERDLAIFEKQF